MNQTAHLRTPELSFARVAPRLGFRHIFSEAVGVALILWASFVAPQLLAQGYLNPAETAILDFRNVDNRYIKNAVERIDDLTSRHYGTRLKGNAEHDIRLLQRLLSDDKIAPDQLLLLQSAGIALGEVLAKEQGVKWVRFQDQKGTSRALLIKETEDIIFPATMISRRYKVGLEIDVQRLYDKAVDFINHTRQIAAESY